MQSNTYKSEIDQWLLVTMGVATVASLLAIVPLLLWGQGLEWLVAVPILLLGAGLPWWILATTEYTVSDYTLAIRSGPFHWDIPLREIVAISKTSSALSSPALSLDRLRIDRSSGRPIMISPENRKRFLDDLRSRGTVGLSTL